MDSRYTRNMNTLSQEDQALLGRSRICVLGLGGLGGSVCELLTRIGVESLTLVDGDQFDPSNLNRQLLSTEALIGSSKAKAAQRRIRDINSQVKTRIYEEFARPETMSSILSDADLVVDCLDTIDARFMAQEACEAKGIPLVSGAIAGVTGQVMVIYPGDKGFELVYGSRPEEGEPERGIETRTGNLAHCAMFVASLQVSECLKVLLNRGEILRNRLLIADLWTNTIEIMALG